VQEFRLLGDPALQSVSSEAPVAADLEARNLARPDHPIQRDRVDIEHLADLFQRQDFMIGYHGDAARAPCCLAIVRAYAQINYKPTARAARRRRQHDLAKIARVREKDARDDGHKNQDEALQYCRFVTHRETDDPIESSD
jgi:hypothetical protein